MDVLDTDPNLDLYVDPDLVKVSDGPDPDPDPGSRSKNQKISTETKHNPTPSKCDALSTSMGAIRHLTLTNQAETVSC